MDLGTAQGRWKQEVSQVKIIRCEIGLCDVADREDKDDVSQKREHCPVGRMPAEAKVELANLRREESILSGKGAASRVVGKRADGVEKAAVPAMGLLG
jgi:hypothetical protein